VALGPAPKLDARSRVGASPPADTAPVTNRWLTKRRRRFLLGTILLVALAVRIFIVYRANSRVPNDASRLGGDEPEYDSFARNLLAGHWSDYPIRGPGYPLLLALLRVATGGSYDLIVYLQAVIGALTVVPAYLLARRVGGDAAGLLCAAGLALYSEFAGGSAYLQSEVLFTPLLLVFLLLLFRALDRPTTKRWVGAGVCLGAGVVTRPTMLPLTVVLGLMVMFLVHPRRAGIRSAVILVATAWLVVTPVTVANAVKFHAFVPVATSTGVVWQGSPEYYSLYKSGRSYLSIWENELNPQVNGGHSVSTAEGDAYFTRRGIASIEAHPTTYLWYSSQKVVFFWLGHPSADWDGKPILDPHGLSYLASWEVPLVMLDRVVPIVALAALIFLIARRRRNQDLLVIYVVLAAFTLLHAALWAELRLSEPLVPLLGLLISVAIVELARPDRHIDERRAQVSQWHPTR
jgi:4-amino-4-deoxy-L-arabinose transferase-like glycosyltransferase